MSRYVHSTCTRSLEETVAFLNRLARGMSRPLEFSLSHKTDSGYSVEVGPPDGPKSSVAMFPNKRLAHSFLRGLATAMEYVWEDKTRLQGYTVSGVKDFYPHEREFCPSCNFDLTNRIAWRYLDRESVSLGVCSSCNTEIVRQELAGAVRLLSIYRKIAGPPASAV